MFESVVSALYSSVDLRSNPRCRDCLEFLISRPDVAGYVKSLVIAPNYLETLSAARMPLGIHLLKEELAIARTLRRVIPGLQSLRKFRWDGLEMLADSVWSALRTQ